MTNVSVQQTAQRLHRLSALDDAPALPPADAWFWLFLAAYYAVFSLWIVFAPPSFYPHDALARIAFSLVRLILMAGPPWIYIRYIDKRNPFDAFRLRSVPGNVWRGLAFGLIVLGTLCAELPLLEGARWRGLGQMTAGEWAAFSTALLIAMIMEEIVFRGFIYRKLRAGHGIAWATLVSTLLFVLIHWPGWITAWGWNANLISLCMGTFVMGATFALIFELTGWLWAAILLHFLCNVCCRLLGA